ncbi:MAG: hypothetical protein H5U40_19085, partial [Polyangiaceae bacterium]|nr:hypothetical protein [Polyangiaceae bacterium]
MSAAPPSGPSTFEATLRSVRSLEPQRVGAVMGLLTLSAYSDSAWYIRALTMVMAFSALLLPEMQRSRTYWAVLGVSLFASDLLNWQRMDNHKYLFAYFALAMTAALMTKEPAETFSRTAATILGLVFVLATTWKVISPDFSDGRFFEFILLTDDRFRAVAKYFAGVTDEEFRLNRRALSVLTHWGSIVPSVPISGRQKVALLAQVLTWWTIF